MDNEVNVIALIVEVCKPQSVVVALELFKLVVYVVADRGRRDVALLCKAEHNAVRAVDFCVYILAVVRHKGIGNVA